MNRIKQYWDGNADKHGATHWASWGDHFAIDLEVETIGKYINAGDFVLDAGCGNGYSTQLQYQQHKIKSPEGIQMVGIDYSAKLIEIARSGNSNSHQRWYGIQYHVGDVLKIDFIDDCFDVVYTTRTLINLPTWEEQIQAIKECIRVTKPGGRVVLSEGFWEPLVKLNAMRLICGLEPLQEHDFNRYLKQRKLEAFLTANNWAYTVDEFSSVYYVGSRLLRELMTDVSKYEGYDNPINELFYEMSIEFQAKGLGIQIVYIIQK